MASTAEYDVIVVGAGVAGGALASVLARDGRRVLAVERELRGADGALAEPDRIVGELLQPGGYDSLCALGLADALEGIDAQHIYGYGIFLGEQAEAVPYEVAEPGKVAQPEGSGKRGPAAVAGRSFHNGRFLRRLREIAEAEERVTLVEGNVTGLDTDADGKVVGVTYRDAEKKAVRARAALTIACDGCASNLRKRVVDGAAKVDVYSSFVGLVLQVSAMPFPCHGHVVLADPAPILFYPISATEVRCLVDIPSTVTVGHVEHMLEVLAPQVPAALRAAFVAAVRAGPAKSMPNRVMPAAPAAVPGAVLLGDSFNMRHPLTGGGMTVALADVAILRELLGGVADLGDAAAVRGVLADFYARRRPLSTTINILANALYAVFCASADPALVDMRAACFDYLAAGGRRAGDPIGMLGGIKPRPMLLLAHFFGVALFGCGRALLPWPSPARVASAWAQFRAAFNIVKPLCDAESMWPLSLIPVSSIPRFS